MALNKEHRLSIRITEYEKARLAEAAAAQGIPVSQFVIKTSLKTADDLLAEESQIAVSPKEFSWLLELTEQSSDVSKLKTLTKQTAPWNA